MVSFSVIVPIYKVELYIGKCIHSLLEQSFNDFEIILIDDRSPDCSIQLAKELLESQSRIPYQIISKEKNEGLSAARNTGIKHSKGNYLLFLDSDDWIEKETLQKLYESVLSTKAGMVVFRIREVYNDGVTPPNVLQSLQPGTLTGKQTLVKLFKNEFPAHICKILFSKSLFATVKFPVAIIYEDMLTLPYLLINEKKVCFIDDVFYNYLQRPGSITRTYDPEIVKVCDKLIKMKNDIKPLLDENQRTFLIRYIHTSHLILCHHASTLSPNYKKAKELLFTCRRNLKTIEVFEQLKERPIRSMFQVLLLKTSTYSFFRKYNSRFRRLNNLLKPVEVLTERWRF